MEVGLTVTRSLRNNTHATGRCSLRVVALDDSPACSIRNTPCNVTRSVHRQLLRYASHNLNILCTDGKKQNRVSPHIVFLRI